MLQLRMQVLRVVDATFRGIGEDAVLSAQMSDEIIVILHEFFQHFSIEDSGRCDRWWWYGNNLRRNARSAEKLR